MSQKSKSKQFLQTLGPGILFASTAIGVSHLIQSTQAGAAYGFTLIGFIIAANLFKFPFFEYGSRYAAATGTSLLDGYRKMHKFVLLLYLVITLASMFFVCAAVSFVAAGFFENLFQLKITVTYFYATSAVLIGICFIILSSGKYKTLEKLIKIIAVTLFITTIIAFVLTLINGPAKSDTNFLNFSLVNKNSLPFIIALMGWMPTAVDLSTWNSLWTIERQKLSTEKASVQDVLLEFNIGYWISAILSLCFVTLGAYLIFSAGESLPDGKVPFAAKVIALFTSTFGNWSFFLIAAASFAIMFGTTIGVLDGYSRTLSEITYILSDKKEKSKKNYTLFLAITCIGSILTIYFFKDDFKALISFATTLSFLIAPIIAILNFKLVLGKDVKKEDQPKRLMRILSYLGIFLLSGFSIFYIYTQII